MQNPSKDQKASDKKPFNAPKKAEPGKTDPAQNKKMEHDTKPASK
ncbi:hypothetical protein [Neptunicella sp.]